MNTSHAFVVTKQFFPNNNYCLRKCFLRGNQSMHSTSSLIKVDVAQMMTCLLISQCPVTHFNYVAHTIQNVRHQGQMSIKMSICIRPGGPKNVTIRPNGEPKNVYDPVLEEQIMFTFRSKISVHSAMTKRCYLSLHS